MKKFKQCCYTRVDGQSVDSGWQTVACSEDLPLEVQKTYGSFMNSYIFGKIPEDKSGKSIEKLMDITVKGNYLYFTRIRYGTADSLNRGNNMFSHTFIFSMKDDEIIKNPNIFLTVKESNFKESEEEARVIPEELDRYEDFTLKGALEICGLNRERYVRLIQGVFAQFYAKRSERKPLYICGLEEEKIPALLYCICMGVPYSMRRNLSCATANLNESLKKNLIFSDSYGASDWYLDVRTGQNNILTNRVMNRLERYGYVTAFPNRWDNPDLGQQFFEALEALAVKLGNPQASDAIILKIAYQMLKYPDMDALVERFDEETLNEKLYEALSSRSENSQYMDSYIARMLERATGQGWRFRDEIEDFLEEKLDHTQSQELLQAGEAYDISCISQCEPEKGAKKLNRLREDKFKVYSRKLVELPNGGEILDVYYSSYALKGEISWKILGDLLRESSYVPKRPLTIDRAEEEAWKLYTSLLDKDESPVKTYESYMEIMSLASEDTGRRKSYERAAKEEYWEHITMEKFSISKRDEYAFFNIFDYPNSKFFIGLLNLLIHVIKREFSKELLIEVTDFAAYNRNAFDKKGRNVFMDLLEDAASRRGGVMEEEEKEWYKIAICLMDDVMMRQAMEICRGMMERRVKFSREYDEFQQRMLKSNRNLKEVSRMINDLYISMARRREEESITPVPLDNWLLLGKYKYDNPFQILDEEEVRALDDNPEIICCDSRLLKEDEYWEAAEDYIHDGGARAKQVKEWLGILRKQRKQKKKEEKSASPVAGLFNKFRKKTDRADEEEYEEEYEDEYEEPEPQEKGKRWRRNKK